MKYGFVTSIKIISGIIFFQCAIFDGIGMVKSWRGAYGDNVGRE